MKFFPSRKAASRRSRYSTLNSRNAPLPCAALVSPGPGEHHADIGCPTPPCMCVVGRILGADESTVVGLCDRTQIEAMEIRKHGSLLGGCKPPAKAAPG